MSNDPFLPQLAKELAESVSKAEHSDAMNFSKDHLIKNQENTIKSQAKRIGQLVDKLANPPQVYHRSESDNILIKNQAKKIGEL